ncbi:NAD(P)-dependent oxidoreductase [Treponema brennaborense]|uniref:D-isomer specific 2-hydroxyacid dehydrogenase NAD-binding protein n=1 Tax=Treponema brennaborense (strain DSM 12168 / CIP 105900 / DD5/3) TaxID=906968 RepID=F4LPC5_TREBD|nr:NAD(P)-dependent oxidoreductase [Treponema brennaborense]AEE16987.1 D-isomer specific 2-hydroxyacid dehydrogenase NAD-binding protein [Treponema brennaborense DSM 12168]
MNILFLTKKEDEYQLHNCFTPEQLTAGRIADYESVRESPQSYTKTTHIFSTWGMPVLSETDIQQYFPQLKYVFYAAGSVQYFARPFLARGVRIFSAWMANAVPVAEFTAAQIILANKGFFQSHDRYAKQGFKASVDYTQSFGGNYGTKVGFLGGGMISRETMKLLKSYDLDLYVSARFLTDEDAALLRVQKTTTEWIFANCQTVSNHLANTEKTREVLNYELFRTMLPNATFINTGRGAQVCAEDLVRAMQEQPARTALLDVTDPDEPLPHQHPYRSCPNIFISPHRAGSFGREVLRLGKYMFDEFQRITDGKEPRYEVTLSMLETMA